MNPPNDSRPYPLPQFRFYFPLLMGALLLMLFFWRQPTATAHPQGDRLESPHTSLNGRVGFSGNPATNDGATCTACHGVGAPVPTINLQGPTTVQAGTTALYTAIITGGPAQTAGINLSVSNGRGTLYPVGSDLQAFLGELTHSAPKAFVNGQVAFDFTWTAPAFNDTVTVYAAGNSTNGQQNLTGDGVATTTFTVQVTGGSSGPPPVTPTPPPATLALRPVVSGLSQPTEITHAGDDRLFVVQKAGTIHVLVDGTLLSTPFLDLTDRVTAGGGNQETGLLGLAFHPDYASNGYVFVNYTVNNPTLRTRVSRFTRAAADPNLADPNSEQIVLEFAQPYANHNGGQLHFGPDGYLYIATGDGGSAGDPDDYGQNNSLLLGKLLRIDVTDTAGTLPDCDLTGNQNYRIPPTNPLSDGSGGTCDEIWGTGLRNPWRFSFDRLTGDVWIGDVGQGSFEEIDFAPATSSGGENYGWRCYEGNTPFNTMGCADAVNYVMPLYTYGRGQGDCSITGGYVYRGNSYPNLNGHYFFSDFCNSTIRSISGAPYAVNVTTWTVSAGGSNPITFGQDGNGELYIGYNNGDIYQLQGSPVDAPVGDCNGDSTVDAGDLSAGVLEIFDNDGNFWLDAPGGTFPGTANCDTNRDTVIDAGDLSCTVLLIFQGPNSCERVTAAGMIAWQDRRLER